MFALKKLTLKSALIAAVQSFILDKIKRAKKQQGENFTFVLNMDDWDARNLFVLSYQDDQPIESAWKEELADLGARYNVTRCAPKKWVVSNREERKEN